MSISTKNCKAGNPDDAGKLPIENEAGRKTLWLRP